MTNERLHIISLTQIRTIYIVIILKILIMTEPNEAQNAETSREAFCRLVNQRIEKVTKSLENLSRLSSRKSDYSEKDIVEIKRFLTKELDKTLSEFRPKTNTDSKNFILKA